MLNAQSKRVFSRHRFPTDAGKGSGRRRHLVSGKWGIALLALFLVPLLFAQNSAKVTALDPTSGKVNDTVTVTGENLGKETVAEVNLSDDNDDFKATLVEQASDKIVMKVPQVKAGRYSLSIKVHGTSGGDRILILPVRFEVTQ